jgi:DNA polymerase-4
MERLIFHVDVNSAYLSWEAVRRVSEGGEDLRLVPAAIGGDPEKRTGVVLAKSIPAKKLGVKTGEPLSVALRKCPNLILARPDFRLYEKNSKAFMDICRSYAPVVEKASIDECFCDFSGTGYLYPDPIATAHELKDRIRDTLGFTVNVGISRNKLLAKMASDFEKPDKVHTLFPEEIQKKMWPLPVGDLFTVGGNTAAKLRRLRINTIGDLARTPLDTLQSQLGSKLGQQLHNFSNGIDDSPVLAEPEEAKGYSISTTMEEDVTETDAAKRILLALADSVTARMRADGAHASCIAVTIRSNDFRNKSHQRQLDLPTDVTSEVYEIAAALFAELWDRQTPLRLLGLSLTNLVREEEAQMSLFNDGSREKARKLDRAVDAIRGKYGSEVIGRGSAMETSARIGRRYKAQMDPEKKD